MAQEMQFTSGDSRIAGLFYTNCDGIPRHVWRYEDGVEIEISELAKLARKTYDSLPTS